MACGLPVLSTPVGETADQMKENSAGRFVPDEGYEEWSKAVLEILDKGMPSTLDIRTAQEAYDWPNVARRFVRVYDDLVSAYYGAK